MSKVVTSPRSSGWLARSAKRRCRSPSESTASGQRHENLTMVDVVLRGGRSFKHLGVYLLEGARGKPRPVHALVRFCTSICLSCGNRGTRSASWRPRPATPTLSSSWPVLGRAVDLARSRVYHFTLSWSLEERVTEEQAHAAAEEALLELELEDREAVVIVHRDTDHLHARRGKPASVPEDGRFAGMGRDQIKLSRWAKGWEQRHVRAYVLPPSGPGREPVRRPGHVHPTRELPHQVSDAEAPRARRAPARRVAASAVTSACRTRCREEGRRRCRRAREEAEDRAGEARPRAAPNGGTAPAGGYEPSRSKPS